MTLFALRDPGLFELTVSGSGEYSLDLRIAGDVKKTLESAIANAENNHGLDVDELVVAEAWGCI